MKKTWMAAGLSLGVGVLLALPASSLAQLKVGWKATFPVEHKDVSLASAGAYIGGEVPLNLDSMATVTVEPNVTAKWRITPNTATPTRGQVVFVDTVPGLRPGTTEQPFLRDKGSISAVAHVNQVLSNHRMVVTVNTTGGPGGKGSASRQGPMMRWNGMNAFLTCFVDFATGTTFLWAGRSAFEFEALGTTPVNGFQNTKPYRIEFTMSGSTARCRVFDGKTQVADTGDIVDAKTPPKGLSGVMIELSMKAPEVPLEGSFTELSATPL